MGCTFIHWLKIKTVLHFGHCKSPIWSGQPSIETPTSDDSRLYAKLTGDKWHSDHMTFWKSQKYKFSKTVNGHPSGTIGRKEYMEPRGFLEKHCSDGSDIHNNAFVTKSVEYMTIFNPNKNSGVWTMMFHHCSCVYHWFISVFQVRAWH